MHTIYDETKNNEYYANYQKAVIEFKLQIERVIAIIQISDDGDDPETTDCDSDRNDLQTERKRDMDLIELARQLGKEIQQDEAYIKMRTAEQASEADEELQELIADFNFKRMAINNESSKTEKDEEKIKELNKDMRHLYSRVMKNENMARYNIAKQEFGEKLQRIIAIIQNSADGDDPETTDLVGGMGCSGRCSSCGGCC